NPQVLLVYSSVQIIIRHHGYSHALWARCCGCPKCKTMLDRDINGVRNILLRYLTKNESGLADVGAYSLTGLVLPNLDFI
ncbi:35011_t:CDS:1, partial [Racocetra persica]